MKKLVLLRHGESLWNQQNRFTGWTDVELTDKGRREAREAGETLRRAGYGFEVAFTSLLRRAIHTLHAVLDTMELSWIEEHKSVRLNERHYGDLQGLDKAETAAKFGEQQVKIWRRSFDTPPPPLPDGDPRMPSLDARYRHLPPSLLPRAESLKDTVARVLPYYDATIVPRIRAGERVLIAAHGNSLRALVKHLDQVPDDEIVEMNIPTGLPLDYELDDTLRPTRRYYLGDPAAVAHAMAEVAAEGRLKPNPTR